jgi:hypothetical protein
VSHREVRQCPCELWRRLLASKRRQTPHMSSGGPARPSGLIWRRSEAWLWRAAPALCGRPYVCGRPVRISTVLSFFPLPSLSGSAECLRPRLRVRATGWECASRAGCLRYRLGVCVPGWVCASSAGCARLRLGVRYRLAVPLAAVAGCASHLGSSPQSPTARPAARPPLPQHTLTSSPSLHAHAPPTPISDAHDVVCRADGLERRLYTRSASARILPWHQHQHRQRAATREPRDTPSMSDPECLSALRASGEAVQPVQGTHAQPRPAPGAGSSRR